jgi:sugar lactone lactonase YvrE
VRNLTCPNQITEYAPGQTVPSRTISARNCPKYYSSIAFDRHGNLYAAVSGGHRVRVYAPGASVPFRAISLDVSKPSNLVVDHVGRVFVANDSADLAVYAPGQNRILRTLPYQGTPQMLVDSQNYFYLNEGTKTDVYSPGGAKLLYEVRGDAYLSGAALDSNDNFYITNYRANSIGVYKRHSTKMLRVISKGVYEPSNLQVDSSGNLYCVNKSSVTVYAPGASVPSRTIKEGIDGPIASAVDSIGDVYVSNWSAGNVTVYPPGGTKPSETISTGINDAFSLAIGP